MRPVAFWARWVLANTVGEVIGLGTAALAGWGLAFAMAGEETVARRLLFALVMVAAGAFEGAVVGAAQARVLAPLLPRLRPLAWVRATALGSLAAWILGMLPSTALGAGAESSTLPPSAPGLALTMVLAALLGGTAGVILAFFQWRVLRRHLAAASGWLAANAAAWALGMPVVFLGVDLAQRGGSPGVVAGTVTATLAVAGATVGAVHGLWLTRRAAELA